MAANHTLLETDKVNPNSALAAASSATECPGPSASSGTAKQAASTSANTSGRRGRTRSATTPPPIAPSPHPAEMTPQAQAPPSDRAAMTGPSTKNAGSAKLPQACASRLIQYQGADGQLPPAFGPV